MRFITLKITDMMKRNYKLLLLVLLLAFASCSFTTKKFEDPNKDKLLMQIVTYVLEQGHFNPQDINDDFSKRVFNDYIEQLDPLKRYFYASDIEEFKAYETQLDDQIKVYDVSFFDLTYERYVKRLEESKAIYKDILSEPFDYTVSEQFYTDNDKLEYVSSKKELKERWRKQLKFSTISNYDDLIRERENTKKQTLTNSDNIESLDTSILEKSDTDLEIEAREASLEYLNELYAYIDDRERKDLFSVYMNAIVDEFDPHTDYYAPVDKDRFNRDMKGNFEGIGARLQKKMDAIVVNEIISGGPAWRQNELEVGDQIMKVRQADETEALNIVGMKLDDAIEFIKGPKGTEVTLTLKKVDGTIEDITITRDIVELEETYVKSSTVIKDGKTYGVINLPKFYVDFQDYNNRNCASDMKIELERLKAQGVEGIVLDLRNNGGGSLPAVVDMGGLFIEEGPIVQVKDAAAPKEVYSDKDPSIVWDGPLVILVNEVSASASEILAAAMQDYKRAIVIGSKQTYGKGTVQTFFDLNRMVRMNDDDMGALKFTIQKFYRINGGSTQLEGVKSDVVVPDRYSYIDIGERDLENPLAWSQIDPVDYTLWNGYYDYEATIEKSNARMAGSEQLKLIDENAKWVKKMRDREVYSLNYDQYRSALEQSEEEAKRFDKLGEYKTNLTFESLPYEVQLMEQDTVLKEKRKRWHKSLSKDVYIEEALNVLNDLKMTYEIKKVASSVKN